MVSLCLIESIYLKGWKGFKPIDVKQFLVTKPNCLDLVPFTSTKFGVNFVWTPPLAKHVARGS